MIKENPDKHKIEVLPEIPSPLVRIYTRMNKVGRVGSLVDICNVDRIVGLI